jgi:hypothetical protein
LRTVSGWGSLGSRRRSTLPASSVSAAVRTRSLPYRPARKCTTIVRVTPASRATWSCVIRAFLSCRFNWITVPALTVRGAYSHGENLVKEKILGVSKRHTRLELVESSDTARNYRNRGVVPWEVVGQLLIEVWRDGLEAQRDRIAAEEARKAKAEAIERLNRALDLARESLIEPGPRSRLKRERPGDARGRKRASPD